MSHQPDSGPSRLACATARLAENPVPVGAIVEELCAEFGLDGATLVLGQGLEETCVASVGETGGMSVLTELPTATWTGLHLYGSAPAEVALAPWIGVLVGALGRRDAAGGDPMERLFSAGSLMRAMAHDLRNLLGVFDQNIQFVHQGLEELEVEASHTVFEDIEQVQEATQRVLSYVQRVHELAHILQGPWPTDDGASSFARGLQSFEGPQEAGGRGVVHVDDSLPEVQLDATRVQLLATELVTNAVQAGADRFELRCSEAVGADPLLQAWAAALPEGPWVFMTCSDNGDGMDVFVLARCGEALFSYPPSGDRAGLGFSLVRGILGAVGGQAAVTSVRGEGSQVVLAIPGASHGGPWCSGEVTSLVPHSERMAVALRLAPGNFRDWVAQTLVDAQFDIVDSIESAVVLVADRDGAEQHQGASSSLFLIGKGWPAGMARPDAVMPPQYDRDGFIRRLSMAVARRTRRG